MDEPEIRRLDSAQLRWLLAGKTPDNPNWTLLIACDELLKRKEPISSLNKSFEALVRSLTTRQLKFIDEHESSFELATVFAANYELRSRGMAALAWFAESTAGRVGPCDRTALQELLHQGKIDGSTLVWREGMKEWRALSSVKGFDRSYFFRQEIPDQPKEVTPPRGEASGSFKTAGILQFVAFPFWLIMIIVGPLKGAGSSTGWTAPLLFSMIMTGISIPLGLGLYRGSDWAIRVKTVAAILTSAWFFSWYFVDEMSRFWLFAASLELILLTFVLVSPRIKMI